MKVVAMIVFQCAVLYCVIQGHRRLELDRRAAESAGRAEQELASARSRRQIAERDNRGVDAAKRAEVAAFCAERAAQEQFADCTQRDWPYRAILEW